MKSLKLRADCARCGSVNWRIVASTGRRQCRVCVNRRRNARKAEGPSVGRPRDPSPGVSQQRVDELRAMELDGTLERLCDAILARYRRQPKDTAA